MVAHERGISIFAFAAGFLWDSLTLTRVDRLFDNLVLASYLLVVFVSIMLTHAHKAGRFQGPLSRKGVTLFQFLLPFAFGGLFSGFLIFYFRSGEVLANAPFLLVLVALLVGTEFFRHHYQRFTFQLSVFFVALFSYAVLIVPVLLRRIGDIVFLLSGLVAILTFTFLVRLLARVDRVEYEQSRRTLFPIIGIIYITFNFLYFNNMIPPIPLSLKEIGVYHTVERAPGGGYFLSYEKAPWYAIGLTTSRVFHRGVGESAYAFSSVFAPMNLSTDIRHRWLYFDSAKREWVTVAMIRFPISGGRDEGFRGYSVKENLQVGKWRVDVETLRGQIIGRFNFEVKDGAPLAMKEEKR